jgi:hypothetical protein
MRRKLSAIRIKNSWRIWARHVARIRAKRNAFKFLVEKPEGKGPLGRPRRKW